MKSFLEVPVKVFQKYFSSLACTNPKKHNIFTNIKKPPTSSDSISECSSTTTEVFQPTAEVFQHGNRDISMYFRTTTEVFQQYSLVFQTRQVFQDDLPRYFMVFPARQVLQVFQGISKVFQNPARYFKSISRYFNNFG